MFNNDVSLYELPSENKVFIITIIIIIIIGTAKPETYQLN